MTRPEDVLLTRRYRRRFDIAKPLGLPSRRAPRRPLGPDGLRSPPALTPLPQSATIDSLRAFPAIQGRERCDQAEEPEEST